VIRREFGSMMCANSLAIVNRKAGVLGIMVFLSPLLRSCCLPDSLNARNLLDVWVRTDCWMFGSSIAIVVPFGQQ